MTTMREVIDSCLFRTRFIYEDSYDVNFIKQALAGNSKLHTVDPMRWMDINVARAAAVYGFLAHQGEYVFSRWNELEKDDRGAQAFRLLLSAPDALRNKLRGYGRYESSLYNRIDSDMKEVLDKDVLSIIFNLDGFTKKMQKIADVEYNSKYWTNHFDGPIGFLHEITPANPVNKYRSIFSIAEAANSGIWKGTTVSNCIPIPIYATPTFAAESCVRYAFPFLSAGTQSNEESFGQNVFYTIKFNPDETYNCAPLTKFGQPELLIPMKSEFKVTDISFGEMFGKQVCILVELEAQNKEIHSDTYSRWAWRDFVDGLPIPAIEGAE